jgi:hypothetical protein
MHCISPSIRGLKMNKADSFFFHSYLSERQSLVNLSFGWWVWASGDALILMDPSFLPVFI